MVNSAPVWLWYGIMMVVKPSEMNQIYQTWDRLLGDTDDVGFKVNVC